MSRINTVTKETADAEQHALFTAIQAKLGMVPNFLKILANSPYCVSAHTAIGRKAGLDNAEIHANRSGTSHDAKAAVAVKFARSLLENSGEVTTAEIIEARAAGFSDADLVEIISHVAMNIFTNMIGKASHVDIDFPKIDLKLVA
jgi:hypothetical protein